MRAPRSTANELRAAGCTPEEIDLFLEVERISRRRERARRAGRIASAIGAALARLVGRPAPRLLLPGR